MDFDSSFWGCRSVDSSWIGRPPLSGIAH